VQLPAQDRGSFTIDEWCRYHKISRRNFYLLENQGRAPVTFCAGKKTRRISLAANDAWVAAREAEEAA
jgi:hypothetical protein